jgi:hypothetical protein
LFTKSKVGVNTILARFFSGGVKKIEHGMVVRLKPGDRFTLSTAYYEFRIAQIPPPLDHLDSDPELERTELYPEDSTTQFIPKPGNPSILLVPQNTPASLSSFSRPGSLSRLSSVLSAVPSEVQQFRPKEAIYEPLTPTNTPTTCPSQNSASGGFPGLVAAPQNSAFFTNSGDSLQKSSSGTNRQASFIKEIDLLGEDSSYLPDLTGLLNTEKNSEHPPSARAKEGEPLFRAPGEPSRNSEIFKSGSVQDIFLTTSALLEKVEADPVKLHYSPSPKGSPAPNTSPPPSPFPSSLPHKPPPTDPEIPKQEIRNPGISIDIYEDDEEEEEEEMIKLRKEEEEDLRKSIAEAARMRMSTEDVFNYEASLHLDTEGEEEEEEAEEEEEDDKYWKVERRGKREGKKTEEKKRKTGKKKIKNPKTQEKYVPILIVRVCY